MISSDEYSSSSPSDDCANRSRSIFTASTQALNFKGHVGEEAQGILDRRPWKEQRPYDNITKVCVPTNFLREEFEGRVCLEDDDRTRPQLFLPRYPLTFWQAKQKFPLTGRCLIRLFKTILDTSTGTTTPDPIPCTWISTLENGGEEAKANTCKTLGVYHRCLMFVHKTSQSPEKPTAVTTPRNRIKSVKSTKRIDFLSAYAVNDADSFDANNEIGSTLDHAGSNDNFFARLMTPAIDLTACTYGHAGWLPCRTPLH
ncbi:hypothetical protein ARMGADRAFT_1040941 [Armillaria gallica]|uniref:Uncharacterized protein n=1 Tax=Armillaria gallica TaxID=47427 RepID=A0A2H3CBJ9_ARMGA|nr:hypothetical protein ARMGADRAFT_1040941 [Armillaria gallica]